jgi:hypothetical protein
MNFGQFFTYFQYYSGLTALLLFSSLPSMKDHFVWTAGNRTPAIHQDEAKNEDGKKESKDSEKDGTSCFPDDSKSSSPWHTELLRAVDASLLFSSLTSLSTPIAPPRLRSSLKLALLSLLRLVHSLLLTLTVEGMVSMSPLVENLLAVLLFLEMDIRFAFVHSEVATLLCFFNGESGAVERSRKRCLLLRNAQMMEAVLGLRSHRLSRQLGTKLTNWEWGSGVRLDRIAVVQMYGSDCAAAVVASVDDGAGPNVYCTPLLQVVISEKLVAASGSEVKEPSPFFCACGNGYSSPEANFCAVCGRHRAQKSHSAPLSERSDVGMFIQPETLASVLELVLTPAVLPMDSMLSKKPSAEELRQHSEFWNSFGGIQPMVYLLLLRDCGDSQLTARVVLYLNRCRRHAAWADNIPRIFAVPIPPHVQSHLTSEQHMDQAVSLAEAVVETIILAPKVSKQVRVESFKLLKACFTHRPTKSSSVQAKLCAVLLHMAPRVLSKWSPGIHTFRSLLQSTVAEAGAYLQLVQCVVSILSQAEDRLRMTVGSTDVGGRCTIPLSSSIGGDSTTTFRFSETDAVLAERACVPVMVSLQLLAHCVQLCQENPSTAVPFIEVLDRNISSASASLHCRFSPWWFVHDTADDTADADVVLSRRVSPVGISTMLTANPSTSRQARSGVGDNISRSRNSTESPSVHVPEQSMLPLHQQTCTFNNTGKNFQMQHWYV